MRNELIVKPKTEVALNSKKKDILSYYGVPEMLDKIVLKEKQNILNKLNCGAVVFDAFNKISHSNDFLVEIPSGLREMLKTGKATFDKSQKNPGGFTPNIRINGESGIAGQASIVERADSQALTQSLSNLAMMAMVQSVLAKLDVIDEKLEEIKTAQKDDRVGAIVGYFKGFMDLYPTFKSQEELNYAANAVYPNMQSELAKIHKHIARVREKLEKAPFGKWQTLWQSVKHPFSNQAEIYQNAYAEYVYEIQLYNRLILLTDVILHLKGDDGAFKRNHQIMVDYCKDNMDCIFQKRMQFLMNGKSNEIDNIMAFNNNIELAIKGLPLNNMVIECNKDEIKYLNNK